VFASFVLAAAGAVPGLPVRAEDPAAAAAGRPAEAASAAAPGPTATGRAWAVRRPSVDAVVFRGVVSYDAAGMGTGAMLYPAPNAAGLLAAILTHSLLNEGAKKAQRDRIQADADAVLANYQPVLSGFTNEALIAGALPRLKSPGTRRLVGAEGGAAGDWSIETAPVFSMTRDQRAIVLDNAVRIYAPGTLEAPYAQTIRVVAAPLAAPTDDAEVPAVWLAEQGRRLTDESAALFAESLDVAIGEATGAPGFADMPHRTFRYFEGGIEKMERAQLVEQGCERALIRTLRGWLMSIPLHAGAGKARCPEGGSGSR
jgi:hypothetical protein